MAKSSSFLNLIVLSLIQIGGLGFITLSTTLAVLIGKKIGLRERLLIQESFNYKPWGLFFYGLLIR